LLILGGKCTVEKEAQEAGYKCKLLMLEEAMAEITMLNRLQTCEPILAMPFRNFMKTRIYRETN
jgi:catalase (peroxidase I)